MAPAPMLSLSQVRWAPPGKPEVLAGVSMELAPGELIWIRGPSGGGKSSLLRVLNGLLRPGQGRVEYQQRALAQWLGPSLRRQVALMAQQPVMLAGTVASNLLLPFTLRWAKGRPRPEAAALRQGLDQLGLEGLDLADEALPLSQGQKQRLSFLRLLLMEPRVLLLDEPVSALDMEARSRLEAAMAAFVTDQRAAVLVSHLRPQAAPARLRCLALIQGRLREEEP